MDLHDIPALPNPFTLQSLSPQQAHFCLHIAKFTEHTLKISLNGQHLLIGLSGGADSTALLLIMTALRHSFNFSLSAAHLNHNLRPSAQAEADWCHTLCRQLDIPCSIESVHLPLSQNHHGLEEAARSARYKFYSAVKQKTGATFIATGHQLNDLAEDVLMRLARGTGWPHLSGMKGYDPKRALIRPLLLTKRCDLETFLDSLQMPWCTDESNTDTQFLRNRIRATMIPLMELANSQFLDHIANLWHLGTIDSDFFDAQIAQLPCDTSDATGRAKTITNDIHQLALHKHKSDDTLAQNSTYTVNVAQLRKTPKALRLRYFKHIATQLGISSPPTQTLFQLDATWQGKQFPKVILLGDGYRARVTRNTIFWEKC